MESNSSTPSYQNYQGNVNSAVSPATYAASNSNGTLNPTVHTGGTVLPSTRPQRTNDLTLQTISSVNQVLGNIAPASTPQRGSMYTPTQGLQQTGRQQTPAGIHVLANHQQTSQIFHENTTGQQGTMNVTIVNQFMVVAKDPEAVVRKLVGFHGMSESVDIQKALQDFVPLVHEEIHKQELDINARREELKEDVASLRELNHQFNRYKSSGLPFYQAFSGVNGDTEVIFPHHQPLHILQSWIKARIMNTTVSKCLKHCNHVIIQRIFGLCSYSDLELLNQAQLT